jgi:hypothetical protein
MTTLWSGTILRAGCMAALSSSVEPTPETDSSDFHRLFRQISPKVRRFEHNSNQQMRHLA